MWSASAFKDKKGTLLDLILIVCQDIHANHYVIFNKEYVCGVCPKEKQNGVPLSIGGIKGKKPFELFFLR